MTTYLTIDSSGAHGNNGYKTAKEDLLWSGNGYKNPFVAERAFSALFGTQRSRVQITSPRPGRKATSNTLPILRERIFM